jgi:hypothetical protein
MVVLTIMFQKLLLILELIMHEDDGGGTLGYDTGRDRSGSNKF